VRLSAAQGCRGAESACEFVALGMTREEVSEGGRRAAAFVAGKGDQQRRKGGYTLLFEASGGADFGGEPLVVGGLAFDD